MLLLSCLTGSQQGKQFRFAKRVIRIGRSKDCDIRFDDEKDATVSNRHAEIVFEDGAYFVIDTGSTNGTSVNGVRTAKQRLKEGDMLLFGPQGGVEMRVESFGRQLSPKYQRPAAPTREAPSVVPPQATAAVAPESIGERVKRHADTTTARVAIFAAQKVAAERAKAGGRSSGETLNIMAAAVAEVHQGTKKESGRKWIKVVAAVGGVGFLVAAVMSVIIWQQRKEIQALVTKKNALDLEIEAVQAAMALETNEDRLAELEQRLAQLTGTAESTIGEVAKRDKAKARELANAGDDLDHAIKRILGKFDAQTYAVPPVFKETLQREVNLLAQASNLKYVYKRRNRYWALITKEFSALGLPEEMAYVAWAETQFDPEQTSPAGARGMWQMTDSTARELGLRVDGTVDERLDVAKQTKAAARKLAILLSEFGADSFMLAMASYNRGEAGVRRVLHQVAREKDGFRKEKRDFWHLYRLKRLPQETMDYVPRVLAAAVICGSPKKYGLDPPPGSAGGD